MSKKKLNNTKMRTAYYEVGDKLPELKKQAKELQDEDLVKLASEMESKLKEFYSLLEDRYIWN